MKLANEHLLLIGFLLVIYFFLFKKESYANISPDIAKEVDQIYEYIMNNDPTYVNYLDFLINIRNTNVHIIDSEVFALFKGAKKRNTFTKDMIIEEMKLL